ncbi:MAG: T9SS type A sorting domain-containing protein [Bacteroidales bacterium]|nr:T9SS type A sorting domain-containing protein [Bacteroidales bacterium]
MKKTVLSIAVALMMASTSFAQIKNVARECVLFELLTGVDCYACPDAEHAIEYMLNQGCAIAPVAYQDPYFSVPSLYTPEVSARINYYMNQVCPDLFVDGLTEVEGCYGNTYYMSYYNNRVNVESPFTIAMNLEQVSGNRYKVNCQVEQVGACNGTDVRVFIVLTQDHFPYSWQGETELNHLVRDMIPTNLGTPFTGPVMTFSEEFDINYPLENCHLVAWVQNYVNPKEVYQAVMMVTEVTDGVEENEAPLCRVYPNPAQTQVFVEADNGIKSVKVYDMLGNLVKELTADSKILNVSLSDFSNGVYFFNVVDANGLVSSQRVVVTH